MPWHVVCQRSEIPPGRGWPVRVNGHPIALFADQEQVYAVDNACRHNGAPLDEGYVEEGCVVCPWHGWTYELATGRQVMMFGSGPGLRRYLVDVQGEDVSVLVDG